MPQIPESVLEKIREGADIVEIASAYMSLKKAGRNYKAVCPFHNEKTPSFVISPDKQIFHCFGCGAGGNVFNLVMKMENMTFIESVRLLGQKLGISVVSSEQESESSRKRQAILEANEKAAEFYHSCLLKEENRPARDYFEKRGIKKDTADKFKLGYSPGGSSLIQEMKKAGIQPSLLREAGLAGQGETQGQPHDYFRRRTMFPIFDLSHRVVGFGGRIMDDGEPKYLNTAETAVFSKGRILYGLNVSKEGIRRTGEAIIVEGYMDFLTLYQNGVDNAVASLGTALTDTQISLLGRYTDRPIICYDADTAGQAATLRGLDLLFEREIEPRILILPSGDPDSFIRKNGRDAFLKLAAGAFTLMEYHFKRIFSKYDKNADAGKQKIVAELMPVIGKIKGEVQKGMYLKRLAEELDLVEKVVYAEYERVFRNFAGRDRGKKPGREGSDYGDAGKAESMIIKIMLEDSAAIPVIAGNIGCQDFEVPEYRKIAQVIFEISGEGKSVDFNSLADRLGDEKLSGIVSMLSLKDVSKGEPEKTLNDCVKRVRETGLIKKKREVEKQIRKAEAEKSPQRLHELLVQYQELEKSLRSISAAGGLN